MKEIQLTQGKVALVDDDDYESLSKHKWYYQGGYASRNITIAFKTRKVIKMHRIIMNPPPEMVVDHKDRNRLNNQKNNLRICSYGQNRMNSKKNTNGRSRYKGVSVQITNGGKDKYYVAQISLNGKRPIKRFPFTAEGEVLAAKAYNQMAMAHYREFARLNDVANHK